jgi:hypothetical protein
VGGLLLKKLINEHGKLLGLINPVDLIVILILVIIGMKVVSDYRPKPLKVKQNKITFGLLLKNVPQYLVDSIAVGQDLFEDGTNAYLGKIQAAKVVPAELLLVQSGRIIAVKSPSNKDLRLLVNNRGSLVLGPARSGVYLGKLAVRVGDCLKAHTRYTSLGGEIEFLKINGNKRRNFQQLRLPTGYQ